MNAESKNPLARLLSRQYRAALCGLSLLSLCTITSCHSSPEDVKVIADISYVSGSKDRAQMLDLYLPTRAHKPVPLIVYIHGGAWHYGDKANTASVLIAKHGYASASLNYRLTRQAIFPAQIEDCRMAIRWLRAHAAKYNFDPNRIGVWGHSAGGHLSALLGTSGDAQVFDGDGKNKTVSAKVQAVCDWSGPIDLLAFPKQAQTPDEVKVSRPGGLLDQLFGGPINDHKDLAIQANPATYISKDDPPILIVHGDKDTVVPLKQSEDFYKQLKDAGLDAELITAQGATHELFSPELCESSLQFFDKHFGGQPQ